MSIRIDLRKVGALLRAAVDIADGTANLAERRRALLERIGELTGSDCGHWVWVRGRIESSNILPVGFIHFGYSEEQLTTYMQFSLDHNVQTELHSALVKQHLEHPRSDGIWSIITSEVLPRTLTDPDYIITRWLERIGVGCYAQAGRLLPNDVQCAMTLGRFLGRPQYSPAERDLLNLAFTNIPWLCATAEERVPPQQVEALTSRQRAVAFLMLDGLSRKKIASRLGIGEETVNHHVKTIFRHFNVQSATELAALFLLSQ